MKFAPVFFSLLSFAFLSLLCTGCSDNRASDYCEGLGYTESFQPSYGGQYNICVFPDGTECKSGDFLSGRCGREFSYCALQGYNLEGGRNTAVCVFTDGSTCDEYEYFRGNCKPGN